MPLMLNIWLLNNGNKLILVTLIDNQLILVKGVRVSLPFPCYPIIFECQVKENPHRKKVIWKNHGEY